MKAIHLRYLLSSAKICVLKKHAYPFLPTLRTILKSLKPISYFT